MERQRRRISIVGAGNVACNMAPALDSIADVVTVFSRDKAKAEAMASRLRNARGVDSLDEVDTDTDMVVVAVADDAVTAVCGALPAGRALVAHTSGSVPMDAIGERRRGVFYALQTFSRDKAVDFSDIPFFLEASDAEGLALMRELAGELSCKVYDADSSHRAALHVAAVFACNFANQLWAEADGLLRPYGYDISVFGSLLRETLDKAMSIGPHDAQTGPAMRRDYKVIENHKNKLTPELRDIYDILTRRIIETH